MQAHALEAEAQDGVQGLGHQAAAPEARQEVVADLRTVVLLHQTPVAAAADELVLTAQRNDPADSVAGREELAVAPHEAPRLLDTRVGGLAQIAHHFRLREHAERGLVIVIAYLTQDETVGRKDRKLGHILKEVGLGHGRTLALSRRERDHKDAQQARVLLSRRMAPHEVDGDLLEQPVEVIVNAWNRNIVPWWLLLPQGVSGAIKKRAGSQPFRELARAGAMPLGSAVVTTAGSLPFKAIIHVAGIDLLWRASEESIRRCARSAIEIVNGKGFASVAFPVIGAGSGGLNEAKARGFLVDELDKLPTSAQVIIVRYKRQ